MPQDLTIRGERIQHIYSHYAGKQFLVNRQYQRKLVWTIEQKQRLIESIQKGYPIPLILLTEIRREGKDMYEIIDGLQRLDAITSFIEGAYSFQGKYFDLNSLPETKEKLESGELSQQEPVLEQSVCTALISYEIPFSIYRLTNKNRHEIDDIFLRVNKEGRSLTRQEIRQASSLHPFGQLVRRISAEIRGDASPELLRLDQMKQISISSRELKYGINIENIPWMKHNIITDEKRIRESHDEELVANLLAYMILRTDSNPNDSALDSYYLMGRRGRSVKGKINQIGSSILEQQFLTVYDEVEKLLNASGHTKFTHWIFGKAQPVDVDRYYQIVFLTIHELLIRRKMTIIDYKRVARLLDSIATKKGIPELVEGGYWKNESRHLCINKVVASLEKIEGLFSRRTDDMILPAGGDVRIKRVLDQYALGQTVCSFQPASFSIVGDTSKNSLAEIFKATTALANQGPRSVGYVLIGITDSTEKLERHQSIYASEPVQYGQFYISGVQEEAKHHCGDIGLYFDELRNAIKEQPITPPQVKSQMCQDIGLYSYAGKPVVVIRVEAPDREPCMYDKAIYDHTNFQFREVPMHQWPDIYLRFQ